MGYHGVVGVSLSIGDDMEYYDDAEHDGESVKQLLDDFEPILKGRQLELFRLLRQGATLRQAAYIMEIEYSTATSHAQRLRENIRKRYKEINLECMSLADYLQNVDHPHL